MKFLKGDKVKFWSLQSFYGPGFYKGKRAIVKQNQIGSSVLLIVKGRKESYEVYSKQCEKIK